MDTSERFLYVEDEQGRKQDAQIHEPILNNPDADSYFAVQVIHEHVEDGGDFAEAVTLFGTDELRAAHADGTLSWEDIVEVVQQ